LHLLIAVPTHSQTVEAECLLSLLGCAAAARSRGWTLEAAFHTGPDLDEIRNRIAGDVMAGAADAVLMLDGDQALAPELLLRMVDSGFPVVGATYPTRGWSWPERIDPPPTSVPELLARGARYVGDLRPPVPGESLPLRHGLAPAVQLGGGCWLFRREAFTRMQAAYPDLEGRGVPPDNPATGGNWALFTTFIDDRTGEPLTEDFAFCRRWIAIGGELWLDVASPVLHVGRHAYRRAALDLAEASAA
jgi:hypothetical protein